MTGNRARAVDAALRIIGTDGLHALTHARVDAAAGLPRGSTSNHFRTRLSLIEGAVQRLEELDHETWEGVSGSEIRSPEHLVEAAAAFFEAATGPDRVLTVARYNLFLESMVNDSIRPSLERSRARIETWAMSTLDALAITDSDAVTATMVAYLDGIIFDRLTFRNVSDPRPGLRAVLDAFLTSVPHAPREGDA